MEKLTDQCTYLKSYSLFQMIPLMFERGQPNKKPNTSRQADRKAISNFNFKQPSRESFNLDVNTPPSNVPVEAPITFSIPETKENVILCF